MSLTRAGVAQLVEQLICNQQVVGSTPIASSIRIKYLHKYLADRQSDVSTLDPI